MNYILIDKLACLEIIQGRFYQNISFAPGRNLVEIFKAKEGNAGDLRVSRQAKGVIISSASSVVTEDAIVFDLDELGLVRDCSDADLLIAIQKTLRFCVKYWDNLALSSGEMIPKGSSKAVVFPFPFVANRSGYRITIEREPNAKRLSRRSSGRYLLAYKSGASGGDGVNEEAGLTNFRKAYEEYEAFRSSSLSTSLQPPSNGASLSLGVTTLNGVTTNIPAEQGFERWQHLLTDEQKNFVKSGWAMPHRLEGPAGTGKTLCLVLKCITVLKAAEARGEKHRSIFVVPSDELAETIRNRLIGNGGADYLDELGENSSNKHQSVLVVTLQRKCADLLNYEITESEFLDRDSVESKNTQLLYLDQIISTLKEKELSVLSPYLSKQFFDFLSTEDVWALAQLFRHEVSVVIKGRANGVLDAYKAIPPLDYGLPTSTEADKEFVYRKYLDYQAKLETANQYDIDDIVISAIGQLDTPIWRRRRGQLGFDTIFIDEVHLFNLNEVSVLHYLTKSPSSVPISYSIDRSQAVGDIGWNDMDFYAALGSGVKEGDASNNAIRAVFRSSPEIVELAFCVTTSGASLFTNFQNPLDLATNTFTMDEEKKCAMPCVTYISDDQCFATTTVRQIDQMARSLQTSKDHILVVVFDEQLLSTIKESWRQSNKGFKSLERRGDFSAITEASKAGCPVISAPELVGGLEFFGVILVGCEKGRVPPNGSLSEFGRAFINYRAHNNLYVAITRAKYRVEFIVNKNRGISDILRRAVDTNLLVECIEST